MVLRRCADLELRRERWTFLRSTAAQWRADELASRGHRATLARAVERVEHRLSPAYLPGASPLNRVPGRPEAGLVHAIAERLAALDRPVSARGVLQVEELFGSPGSPLYARERESELHGALLAAIGALEPAEASR